MRRNCLLLVFLLVIVTFANGHEGHLNTTLKEAGTITNANATLVSPVVSSGNRGHKKTRKGSSSRKDYEDFEWTNNDDYLDQSPDYAADDPHAGNYLEGTSTPNQHDIPISFGADAAPSEDTTSAPVSTNPNKDTNSTNHSTVNQEPTETSLDSTDEKMTETISSSTPVSGSSDGNTESVSESTQTDSQSTIGIGSSSTSENKPTSSEGQNSSRTSSYSTEKSTPFAITTQDVGDVSNYTTPEFLDDDRGDSEGVKAWAIVLVSVLISFALIFTILYFIRAALIRRRKEDQRRLLRASISSEGYFYGDGDGSINGKFEL